MEMTEKDLSIKDTLFSGQCFRVSEDNGLFTVKCGVDENIRSLSIRQENISEIEKDPFWAHYFDLSTDYASMKEDFSKVSEVMAKACDFAPGIRILNQDSWEALCSFVVSQNNNIKRIMGIIERMSQRYGKIGKDGIHGFPCADTLAGASEQDLRDCGLGFRAEYIINTATAVCSGRILLEDLKEIEISKAYEMLMQVKGIGPKVASCALLFGCHRLDCFPMDVWMKRVMAAWFNGQDGSIFGPYAGVAQQYLFHYARTGVKDDF